MPQSATNIFAEVGESRERGDFAEHKEESSAKNIFSDLTRLTSDVCTHKNALFARAEKKANVGRVKPVHGHPRS